MKTSSSSWRTDDVFLKLPAEVTDIKETCNDLLKEAKAYMEEYKEFANTVFAVRANEILAISLKWNSYKEKELKVTSTLDRAMNDPLTLAIVTINDCRMKAMPKDTKIEDLNFTDGEICEDESNPEALVMSVTGKGLKPRAVICRYHRDKDGKIIWDEQMEDLGEIRGRMIPEFPQEKPV